MSRKKIKGIWDGRGDVIMKKVEKYRSRESKMQAVEVPLVGGSAQASK